MLLHVRSGVWRFLLARLQIVLISLELVVMFFIWEFIRCNLNSIHLNKDLDGNMHIAYYIMAFIVIIIMQSTELNSIEWLLALNI